MRLLEVAILLDLLGLATALPGHPPQAAASSSGVASSTQPTPASSWQSVSCSDSSIANAAAPPASRWEAADTDDAWNAALAAWNSQQSQSGGSSLPFSAFISNFFHGPEGWNCQDVGNVPCSTVVQCDQVDHPAGFLILNSFSAVHQFYQHMAQALDNALAQMTTNLGTFAQTFAPQLQSDTTVINNVLNAITAAVGIFSSYSWNFFLSAFFKNEPVKALTTDTVNNFIAFAIGTARVNLPSTQDALGTQNTVSSALGVIFNAWKGAETSYLSAVFSGNAQNNSISNLYTMIENGTMTTVPTDIDLSNITLQAEKIMYGQLIQSAWTVAPQGLHPFILVTNDPCGAPSDDISRVIPTDVIGKAQVCNNGQAAYIMTTVRIRGDQWLFGTLPGGTVDVLDGSKFGGVTLDDIFISSYQAYQLNNNTNGYQMPDESRVIDGHGTEGDYIFQNGIRTPGFFNLPICTDVNAAQEAADANNPNSKWWPCNPPEGYNTGGTNIHVNNGCILINGTPKCHPDSLNIPDNNQPNNTATIYAGFSGDSSQYKVQAGCKLSAVWPHNYGDIYFGADNCLYDSQGNRIFGQCCETNHDMVTNPYWGK